MATDGRPRHVDAEYLRAAVAEDAGERGLLEQHGALGGLLCERRVVSDQRGAPLEHTEPSYVAERYAFEAVVMREEQG